MLLRGIIASLKSDFNCYQLWGSKRWPSRAAVIFAVAIMTCSSDSMQEDSCKLTPGHVMIAIFPVEWHQWVDFRSGHRCSRTHHSWFGNLVSTALWEYEYEVDQTKHPRTSYTQPRTSYTQPSHLLNHKPTLIGENRFKWQQAVSDKIKVFTRSRCSKSGWTWVHFTCIDSIRQSNNFSMLL